jgi:hypothetical protein
LAPSGLGVFVIVSRSGSHGQLLQPSGQPFELLVCAEFVQAVNADLNRLGVVVGDTVDLFAAVRGVCNLILGNPVCRPFRTNSNVEAGKPLPSAVSAQPNRGLTTP